MCENYEEFFWHVLHANTEAQRYGYTSAQWHIFRSTKNNIKKEREAKRGIHSVKTHVLKRALMTGWWRASVRGTLPTTSCSEEGKQSCALAARSAGAHLCSWAISWLRSSSSLMPVSSADPAELVLSWGETWRRMWKEDRRTDGGMKRSRAPGGERTDDEDWQRRGGKEWNAGK